MALNLNNLAELYRTQGKYADAEPLYQRALATQEKALGPEHPNVALSLNNRERPVNPLCRRRAVSAPYGLPTLPFRAL